MIWQRRNLLFAAAAACLVAGVVLFFVLGARGTPGDASADAGFARDMGTHHAQAVQMSFIVRDASDDVNVRALTYDIIVTQSAQRGIYMGWLQQWGLDQGTTRPPMAWMAGHGGHGATPAAPATGAAAGPAGAMPGMAAPQEIGRLTAAKGRDAEILFLQLMIRHHEGGVQMARGVLGLSDRADVRTTAQHIIDSQNSEIGRMTELLKERNAEPYPSILRAAEEKN